MGRNVRMLNGLVLTPPAPVTALAVSRSTAAGPKPVCYLILLTKFKPLFDSGAGPIKTLNRGGGGNGRRRQRRQRHVGATGDLLDIVFSVFATHTAVVSLRGDRAVPR